MFFHQSSNSMVSNRYNACFYRGLSWKAHFHKNPEIICVTSGSVVCTVNGTTEELSAGDFGLCLPMDIHSYSPAPDSEYWVCVFSADYVRSFLKQVSDKTAESFRFTCSDSVEAFVRANLVSERTPPQNMLKACLYALCNEYITSVTLTARDSGKTERMAQITDFIAEHHTENIGLSDIAALLGYDYYYVSRYFKKIFNISFNELLNLYRIETAVQLLDETDKKIINVAYESGFQSIRSFNECFKKHLKISPSEYKRTSGKA